MEEPVRLGAQDGNVTVMLQRREIGGRGNRYRKDLKLLRSLILRGKTAYRKVWTKHSKCHISCEGSRMYFDNYKVCYAGTGLAGIPHQFYKLPNCPTSNKIVDALICSIAPEVLPLPDSGHKRSLITLTFNSWLQRCDLHTAAVLQAVYLSPKHKFREVAWVREQERFCIRSTQQPSLPVHRQAGVQVNIARVLAVFDVFPLEFVGMLEIDKRIFGNDVSDCMLSMGLLIIMHQSGHVKIYSFLHILQQFRTYQVQIGEKIPDSDEICGLYPTGLPFNIKVTECPPVLFEVRCSEHNVQIGGFPWHYIITPHGCHGWFEVLSLGNHQLAKNGELDASSWNIEPDRAVFHTDESGRILHISDAKIRMLQLHVQDFPTSSSALHELFTVQLDHKAKQKKSTENVFTSSGRSVKKRVSIDEVADCSSVTIHDVDYEDELDVLTVSTVSHNPDGLAGCIGFYDNLTGKLLREITLEEPVQEYYEHRVFLDTDTVIQRIKVNPRKFMCVVYKLFGDVNT